MQIPLSSRVEELKERKLCTFSREMFDHRRETFERVYADRAEEPKILRKARALAEFLRTKPIILFEDDLVAGYQQPYDFSEPPDGHGLWSTPVAEAVDDTLVTQFREGMEAGLYGFGPGEHVVPDYGGVLRTGLASLLHRARQKASSTPADKSAFYQALSAVLEGASDYIRRYGSRASEMVDGCSSSQRSVELRRIASACERVADNQPRNFFEAVQLFWLLHEILTAEQSCGSLSPGRVDQFLYPFYMADIKAGRMGTDAAQEIMDVLWVKFNVPPEQWRSLHFQNIALGGQDSEGNDATNELSYMCLAATERLQMIQPSISARCHEGSPRAFLDAIAKVVKTGTGFPAIFNDEATIEAKLRVGATLSDARDYAIVGCVEPTIPGKEFSHTEATRINLPKLLEWMITRGQLAEGKEPIPLKFHLPQQYGSFDHLFQTYRDILSHSVRVAAEALRYAEQTFPLVRPYPYLSAIMEGPLTKGRDVSDGGTVYNHLSINVAGQSNTADALAAIRKLVFDEGTLDWEESRSVLNANFDGSESLRQQMLNRSPKFGNDCDEVDSIMKDMADHFCKEVGRYRSTRGGLFQVGFYSVAQHTSMGARVGALPDGRASGSPLASSFSPVQGRDRSGPTAVVKSLTKIDHSQFSNGMVLDLKMTPEVLRTEEGERKLMDLVRAYFRRGGMEIQFNVVTSETLRRAQESPEHHRNLVVRVSGFSAYFVTLDPACQSDIIERAEHHI